MLSDLKSCSTYMKTNNKQINKKKHWFPLFGMIKVLIRIPEEHHAICRTAWWDVCMYLVDETITLTWISTSWTFSSKCCCASRPVICFVLLLRSITQNSNETVGEKKDAFLRTCSRVKQTHTACDEGLLFPVMQAQRFQNCLQYWQKSISLPPSLYFPSLLWKRGRAKRGKDRTAGTQGSSRKCIFSFCCLGL